MGATRAACWVGPMEAHLADQTDLSKAGYLAQRLVEPKENHWVEQLVCHWVDYLDGWKAASWADHWAVLSAGSKETK